jgi:hypothetical protein
MHYKTLNLHKIYIKILIKKINNKNQWDIFILFKKYLKIIIINNLINLIKNHIFLMEN